MERSLIHLSCVLKTLNRRDCKRPSLKWLNWSNQKYLQLVDLTPSHATDSFLPLADILPNYATDSWQISCRITDLNLSIFIDESTLFSFLLTGHHVKLPISGK